MMTINAIWKSQQAWLHYFAYRVGHRDLTSFRFVLLNAGC